jgi:hypothetical protein
MVFNWRAIINFILFAMIVVAFTFAIWSYVKTNAIKNSNSPSVSTVINDNNTYVNNIASAPNSVLINAPILSNPIYKLSSTDNGTTFLLTGDNNSVVIFDIPPIPNVSNGTGVLDKDGKLISGYYIKVVNMNNETTGNIIEIDSNQINGNPPMGWISRFKLKPGQEAYYYQKLSGVDGKVSADQGWISPADN